MTRLTRLSRAGNRTAAWRTVIARSSFLVNADPVGRAAKESIVLDEGAVIEVLPPFAGRLRRTSLLSTMPVHPSRGAAREAVIPEQT